MRRSLIYTLYIGAIFLMSCSSSNPSNIDRGSSYQYRPGFPEVRFSAIGIVDVESNNSFIKLSGDIVYKSLVFKNIEDSLRSSLLIEYNIESLDDKSYIVSTRPRTVQIIPSRQNVSVARDMFSFEEDVSVKPGAYKIQLLVTDQFSGKQTIAPAYASIPNPADPVPHMTNIRILGKDEDKEAALDFFTLNTYDITNEVDSLKFVFQVTNNKSDDPLNIRSRLIRFDSDTSISRMMFLNNYTDGSLEARGINYGKETVIQSTRRSINQSGSVLIEYKFKNLQRGNYRFEVESDPIGEEEEVLYKARDFGIKSENYPILAKAHELAAPLRYLMNNKEYDRLMSIRDADSLKIAMDKFWLSNIKDPKIAKNVIALYYERVEEANKLFSNFKEGWKTDLGMIYILFGPPWYMERSLTDLQWFYSYNRSDFNTTFFFRAPRLRDRDYPFENYLFIRSNIYIQTYNQQQSLWLSGAILRDNL